MILALARRELAALFLSPLAWVLLAVHQILLAFVLLRVVERFSGLEAAQRGVGLTQELTLNLFGFGAVLLLVTLPLLTMRLLSGELRDGTWELLAGSPVSLSQILLGKLLGLWGLVAALLALPPALSLALLPWSPLDLGLILAATLGLALAALAFSAIGLYASSLTDRPPAAAAAAYGILLLLSVIGETRLPAGPGEGLLDWAAWNGHLLPFLLGLVPTADAAYFLILTGLFLGLALRGLHRLRDR